MRIQTGIGSSTACDDTLGVPENSYSEAAHTPRFATSAALVPVVPSEERQRSVPPSEITRPMPPPPPGRLRASLIALMRAAVLAADAIPRRYYHVYEYDSDPECILRVTRRQCQEMRVLADGTVLSPGDAILEFHYWNEHIPQIGPEGPSLRWGMQYHQALLRSFWLLARYIRNNADCDNVVAIHAELSCATQVGGAKYRRMMTKMGFEFFPMPTAPNGRLACFFEFFYVWALMWAQNPYSLRGKSFQMAERTEMWMSRATLLERHGKQPMRHQRDTDGSSDNVCKSETALGR